MIRPIKLDAPSKVYSIYLMPAFMHRIVSFYKLGIPTQTRNKVVLQRGASNAARNAELEARDFENRPTRL